MLCLQKDGHAEGSGTSLCEGMGYLDRVLMDDAPRTCKSERPEELTTLLWEEEEKEGAQKKKNIYGSLRVESRSGPMPARKVPACSNLIAPRLAIRANK